MFKPYTNAKLVTHKAIALSKADPGGKEEKTLAGTMVLDIAVKSMTIVQVQAKKGAGFGSTFKKVIRGQRKGNLEKKDGVGHGSTFKRR